MIVLLNAAAAGQRLVASTAQRGQSPSSLRSMATRTAPVLGAAASCWLPGRTPPTTRYGRDKPTRRSVRQCVCARWDGGPDAPSSVARGRGEVGHTAWARRVRTAGAAPKRLQHRSSRLPTGSCGPRRLPAVGVERRRSRLGSSSLRWWKSPTGQPSTTDSRKWPVAVKTRLRCSLGSGRPLGAG